MRRTLSVHGWHDVRRITHATVSRTMRHNVTRISADASDCPSSMPPSANVAHDDVVGARRGGEGAASGSAASGR
jgi:hypothetical protein